MRAWMAIGATALFLTASMIVSPIVAGSLSQQDYPDTDGDGLTDDEDGCFMHWGPREIKGCPLGMEPYELDYDKLKAQQPEADEEEPEAEPDGGGEWEDDEEAPAEDDEEAPAEDDESEALTAMGDPDGDDIINTYDACPYVAAKTENGCPAPEHEEECGGDACEVESPAPAEVPELEPAPVPAPAPAPASVPTLKKTASTDGNRVARVAAAVDGIAAAMEALIEAAEAESKCRDLAHGLNTWAVTYKERVWVHLKTGYALGLSPDEAKNAEVKKADLRFEAAAERWSKVKILMRCESEEVFQRRVSDEFVEAFGYLRGGAGEFTLEAEDFAAVPVFEELVGLMETMKAAVDKGGSCGQLHRRLNQWWSDYGVRYEAARQKAFATPFLEHDDDTSLAEREAYGTLITRYETLSEWMDDPGFSCTEDPGDKVELTTAIRDGLDIPPDPSDWGRPEDTWENRQKNKSNSPW